MPGVLGRGPGRRPVSALHVPLGWHARGDHAEVELDDDRNVVLGLVLKVEGNAEVHMSPDEARALAAALVHYADEAQR